MNPKTVLGISFTTVFALSIISAVTTIQADTTLKIKHLPDLKTTKTTNTETMTTTVSTENSDLTSFGEEEIISGSSILNKQLKN